MQVDIAIVPRGDGKIAVLAKPSPGRISWAAVIGKESFRDVFTSLVMSGHPEIMPHDIIEGLGGTATISLTTEKILISKLKSHGAEMC